MTGRWVKKGAVRSHDAAALLHRRACVCLQVLQRCQLICIGIAVCLGTAAWSGLHFLVSSFICNCLLVVLGLASARQEYHLHCMHERQKHWLEKLMQGFAHILAAVATALALAVVGTVRFLLTIIAVRGRMNCPSRRMVCSRTEVRVGQGLSSVVGRAGKHSVGCRVHCLRRRRGVVPEHSAPLNTVPP